jgi:hypothetical protein
MSIVAKFVQPIPIVLAYLVPLDALLKVVLFVFKIFKMAANKKSK